jgi:aminoglycoside phosphotransferase (APT) family kinase protein
LIDVSHIARLLGLPAAQVAAMPSFGVAHDHYRLIGEGKVLRVPRAKALQGLAPATALARQAAAFARGAQTRHAPRFYKALPPGDVLPNGGLVVEEINGRPPRLPDDLPLLAAALAAVHRLPVPPEDERPPLPGSAAPIRRLFEFVRGRMGLFEQAKLAPSIIGALRDQLATADRESAASATGGDESVTVLVGVDVHPGNFLIDADGSAVLTDWERAQYGHPAADLAHATLPTSTGWDPAVAATLTVPDTAAFYAAWERCAGSALADACRPAFTVTRRLVWLRTLTWMAHWRNGGGEDARRLSPEAAAHMNAHAAKVLSADGVSEALAAIDI